MTRTPHLKLVTMPDADRVGSWRDDLVRDYRKPDAELIVWALNWVAAKDGGFTLDGGEPVLSHAVHAALILRELKLDAECVAAGLIARYLPDREATLAAREAFGARVAELAEGVQRMAVIEDLGSRAARGADAGSQLEGLRKMLLAMAQDVRVVLIKLADHVQTMRYVVTCDEVQARHDAARLSLDIFAPLANRLGVWQLKWELEDLALRILEPQTYRRIAGLLDEKREGRQRQIEAAMAMLRDELKHADIKAEVSGRPKHIYSIYNKMRRKDVEFDAIYDVRAVRVMVDSVKDCYAALGIVHNLWTPLSGEFDDYIAKPKRNDYRSLHTAVTGADGKPLEIQIRTHEMHQHAEFGVAAHWRYKEGAQSGARREVNYQQKIAWLRQIVEWKDEVADAGELAAQFRSELFADTIYVLTPQGRVVDLPRDATPIDFAYHVHSDLGHHCRGAKVDGVMVALNTPLRNGQQVEIVAASQGGPSRDWLNPSLGFVRSPSARNKVRQWFNRQNHDMAAAQGRDIVERELRRLGLTGISLDGLARKFDYDKQIDFLAEVSRGGISARQLREAVRLDQAVPPAGDDQPAIGKPRARSGGILIVGVDKLLTVPAKCCKPAPPDSIIGFVTRGKGVTIHRGNCANVARLAAERLIAAQWGMAADATFAVDVEIDADDRTGLLRDVAEIFSRERINVIATRSASRAATAHMMLTVEISNLDQLNRVLTMVRAVQGVASARRR